MKRAAKANPSSSSSSAKRNYRRLHWGLGGTGATTTLRVGRLEPGEVLTELGELVSVVYRTSKLGDLEAADYEHTFKRRRPVLAVDKSGALYICGGGYRVSARGIIG